MATKKRELTKPIANIAIPGFPTGSPSFESRADLTQGKKTGVAGRPGIYDEMYQQFPPFRRQVDRGRARLSTVKVETTKCGTSKATPNGDESPLEAAFFDAVDDMLFNGRLRIENGDGYSEGFGEFCGWAFEAVPFGFVLGDPWLCDLVSPENQSPELSTATLTISPMQRAAVSNWGLWGSGAASRRRPEQVTYREAIGIPKTLQYSDLLHIQHGGAPGEPSGQALARVLVAQFMAWRDSLINAYYSELVSRGVPVVKMPSANDTVNFEAAVDMMTKWAEGNLKWVGLPAGSEGGIMFPSGTPPDYIAKWTKLESAVAEVFDDGLTLIGLKNWGSRASAEVMQGDDAENARARLDQFVNRCYRKLVEWIAAQVGFTLVRCRAARTLGEAAVDASGAADIYVKLAGAGFPFRPEHHAWVAEAVGLPNPEAMLTASAPAQPATPTAPVRRPILGATLREHSDDEEHPASCGCGRSAKLADEAERFEFVTRTGRTWQAYRRPFEVEIDGRLCTPELGVAWADDADKRSEIDAGMIAAVGGVVAQHRADAIEVYNADGYSKAESDRLFTKWQPVYADAIEVYARDVAKAANASRREELDAQTAQASPTSRAGLSTGVARQVLATVDARVQAQIDNAADTLASRVQGQVDRGWISGGLTGAIAAAEQQTVNGLARDVRPVGNVVEAASAVESAAAPGDGFVVIAAIRSTMNDKRVCAWCKSQDKITFRFPEDTARFLAYVEVHGPPDADCDGGDDCRCRFVTVLGKEGAASS